MPGSSGVPLTPISTGSLPLAAGGQVIAWHQRQTMADLAGAWELTANALDATGAHPLTEFGGPLTYGANGVALDGTSCLYYPDPSALQFPADQSWMICARTTLHAYPVDGLPSAFAVSHDDDAPVQGDPLSVVYVTFRPDSGDGHQGAPTLIYSYRSLVNGDSCGVHMPTAAVLDQPCVIFAWYDHATQSVGVQRDTDHTFITEYVPTQGPGVQRNRFAIGAADFYWPPDWVGWFGKWIGHISKVYFWVGPNAIKTEDARRWLVNPVGGTSMGRTFAELSRAVGP